MKVLFVTNAYPSSEQPWRGTFIKAQIDSLSDLGIDSAIMEIKGYLGKLEYLKSILSLRRILRKKCFDIIHCHYSFSAIPALFQFGTPVVISFMGSDINGDYNSGSIRISRFLNRWFSKCISYKAAGIICKTEQMASALARKAVVIPNGVDFNVFLPREKTECRKRLGIPPDQRIVLFPADPLKRVKNYSLAEEAVGYAETLLGEKIHLLAVYKKGCSEYLDYLNAADMVIITSWSEGSSNVLKESLACNIPVVSVNVGDAEKNLKGKSCCHVTTYDPEDIGEKIKSVLCSEETCNTRGESGNLELKVIAERIHSVYTGIISK